MAVQTAPIPAPIDPPTSAPSGADTPASNAALGASLNMASGAASKHSFWTRIRAFFVRRLDSVPLATKIVACTVVLLIVGTAGISFTLRQLVSNYMLEKTDTQLLRQSQLVLDNIKVLSAASENDSSNSCSTVISYKSAMITTALPLML